MTTNGRWLPYTDELGEELNDSRAWCIAGDFTNLKIFDINDYFREPIFNEMNPQQPSVTKEGDLNQNHSNLIDAQVLHRVCNIIDAIIASIPSLDPSLAPIKVLFADKESLKTFQECAAVHDRPFTFSCFDCANDACYVNTKDFYALVMYCIAHPLPLSPAAKATAATTVVDAANGSERSMVCPFSASEREAPSAETDNEHKDELCHCSEDVPSSLTEPIRQFILSVSNGSWPKAPQGQAPSPCNKPCDKLGLTSALKAVESTYIPLVYEPLCDVATVVYSTRCPCCPDVTYMVDRVVAMINKNRLKRQGEAEWDPMWSDIHSPCLSTSAIGGCLSPTHYPNSSLGTIDKHGASFNDYNFDDTTVDHTSSLPLSSSMTSRPPQCPCDCPCIEGGLVGTGMRVVLCNIDENDLSSADWPTDPCEQIVPHIRFYPATDLSDHVPRRPITRLRKTIPLSGPGSKCIPVEVSAAHPQPMGSREYYHFLQAADAAKTAFGEVGASRAGLPSRSPHQETLSTSPTLTADYFHGKKNHIFGLKCEDRSAENVAKFFLSHAKRTIVTKMGVEKVLAECRAMDAPKKRSRSDANIMVLSPSGNAIDDIGR